MGNSIETESKRPPADAVPDWAAITWMPCQRTGSPLQQRTQVTGILLPSIVNTSQSMHELLGGQMMSQSL